MDKTIIKIRKGINGFKYSACDKNGCFLRNFKRLSDVRKYWKIEIKYGLVELVRELDKEPDMSQIEAAKKEIDRILKEYGRRKRK